jgi:hypothetical protein
MNWVVLDNVGNDEIVFTERVQSSSRKTRTLLKKCRFQLNLSLEFHLVGFG